MVELPELIKCLMVILIMYQQIPWLLMLPAILMMILALEQDKPATPALGIPKEEPIN